MNKGFLRNKLVVYLEVLILATIIAIKFGSPIFNKLKIYNKDFEVLYNYLVYVILIHLVTYTIKYFYSRKNKMQIGEKDNFIFGIDNIGKMLTFLGFVVTIFGFFGINMKELLTSMSIIAAALAIISKEFVNDFFIGLYFSFSKDFEINDYVKIENHKGKIAEIGLLKVKVLNEDDVIVIIPNSIIYNNDFINYTKRDVRTMSIDFETLLASIDNVELFEHELINSLQIYSDYIDPNSYNLKIVDMKKDYINFKFQFRIKHYDSVLQKNIRRSIVRKVFNYVSSKGH